VHGVANRPSATAWGFLPEIRDDSDCCRLTWLCARLDWLADLDPATVKSGAVGMFVFVPGSLADDDAGYWQVEAEGPTGCLRVVAFHPTEDDAGLDIAAPIVIEGELVVIRHPARGEFPAVVELQVREAFRVR